MRIDDELCPPCAIAQMDCDHENFERWSENPELVERARSSYKKCLDCGAVFEEVFYEEVRK